MIWWTKAPIEFVFCFRRFFFEEAWPSPIAHTKFQKSSRQTKIEWKCDGVRAGHARLRACGEVHWITTLVERSNLFQVKRHVERAISSFDFQRKFVQRIVILHNHESSQKKWSRACAREWWEGGRIPLPSCKQMRIRWVGNGLRNEIENELFFTR